MIAVAIIAIVVPGVFLVSIASTRARTGLSSFEDAARATLSLSEVLHNYVSADTTTATVALAPGGSWKLPGDGCSYALQPGCEHDGSNYLPVDLKIRYPEAKLKYDVVGLGAEGGMRVDFRVTLQ